jgi:hypothetical protein
MVDRALRRSMAGNSPESVRGNMILIARRSPRSTHGNGRIRKTRKVAIQSLSVFFMSSKREPHNLDFRGGFDALVANDEIQRRCRGRFCCWRTSGRRGRSRGGDASNIRGHFTRRPFVPLVSNVQEANDAELLVRPGDLIEDFSRRRRRGNKGRLNNIALEQLRTGQGHCSRFSAGGRGSRRRRGGPVFFL